MSVITARFLMRLVFHKFRKISESPQKLQRHRSVWVGQADFEKSKKTKDIASGAVNTSHLTQI